MDMKRFFLYFMVIAALALAGCGGNGGTASAPPDDDDPPASCPDGQTGTPPNCVTPGPSVADLFETAQNASDAAEAAEMDAKAAVEAADKASMKLGTLAVGGNSMMAKDNAQSVLDNQTTVNDAVKTAQEALADLKKADTDADEHNNSALDRAIAAAIKVADEAIEETQKQADSTTLKDAVKMVKGTSGKGTPASKAKTVAEDIRDALEETGDTDGTAQHVDFNSATLAQLSPTCTGSDCVPQKATATATAAVMKEDGIGMTWKEIVGAANVMKKRIVSGSNTKEVDANSVNGEILIMGGALPSTVANGQEFIDDTSGARVMYKGIAGTLFCQGSDCEVKHDSNGMAPNTGADDANYNRREVSGSWYFTPSNSKEVYVRDEHDDLPADLTDRDVVRAGLQKHMRYMVETAYVKYGYWLAIEAGDLTINTYAVSAGAGTTATVVNTSNDYNLLGTKSDGTTALTDKSATYEGNAIGMSYHETFDDKGMVVKESEKSGEFTADVELTATFGAAATLDGKVMNFQGDAVDPTWEVRLREKAFTTGAFADGVTTGGGLAGDWTAQAYGDNGEERPDGIFGNFNAHFSNGAAAGAYATKKQP